MLSKNATYLLEKRYCKPGETPEGVFKRTAEVLAQGDSRFEEKLYDLMIGGIFLPNSPCLFNAGNPNGSLHACFTLDISDDLESIFLSIAQMAKIFKGGGGVGINFSTLRERNASLSGGGSSSGVVSFMSGFDTVVEIVKQGGKRRGALMGILNYCHPEILDFVTVKLEKKLQNFNLSVMVDDEFMKMVDSDKKIDLKSPKGYTTESVKVKDIFEVICFSAWKNGDPAFLFFDRINKDNPFYPEIKLEITNPCSEVSLPPYSACDLGSINLSKFIWKNEFNFDRFEEVCKLGMKALSTMNQISFYPLPEIVENMKKYNPVGLGIMGFADCLIKLGVKYDSQDCLKFIDNLGAIYKKATEEYNKDQFYFYRRIIAPTGSLSLLADCFTGDTKISLLNGKEEKIQNLVDREFYIYSYDIKNERIRPGKATAKKFRKSKVMKIMLDNGEEIKCTPDHEFLLKNGSYKMAQNLNTKDSLMPFYRRYLNLNGVIDEKGYEQVLQSCKFHDYWIFTHRRTVYGKGRKGDVVHHKDFDKRNNDPGNLVWMNKEEHWKLHSELACPFKLNNPSKRPEIRARRSARMKEDNPMKKSEISSKVSKKLKGRKKPIQEINKLKEWIKVHGNSFKGRRHSQESLSKMSNSRKDWMKINDNPNARKDISKEKVKSLRNSGFSWKEIASHFNCDVGTVRKRYLDFPFKKKHRNYVNHTFRMDVTPEKVEILRNGGMTWFDISKKLSCGCGVLKRRFRDGRYLGRNHRIVSIELLEEEYETYCLIVEDYHNFALSSGVFVHNCSSGIEPIYDTTFERNLVVGVIQETRDLYKSEFVRTAYQVSPEWHVKVLAQWQKWVDGGVSKTVNLPHDASVDDIKNIYKLANKLGCKGITVYRDGCRPDQVLVSKTNKFSFGKCSDETCSL